MRLLSHFVLSYPVPFKAPLTKWIRHHQGCHGNNKYCSFTLCRTIKDILEWDLTPHQTTHHVTKESAPLLCIIMNYYLNVWVGEILQYCPLCSSPRTPRFPTAASVTSAFYNLFTSIYTSVCPSRFAPSLLFFPFFTHPYPAAVECCGSQCFIYHCVPREDMFHPPGRVAVPDRSQSVCWLNNGAREGKGKWGPETKSKVLPYLSLTQPWLYKKKVLATNQVFLN